ncbi:MAG: Stp1/IreP family PP2C-type Ser/Thr phosphatase [Desulfobacteraceae bacterium]|nr:Stp1/IreP family PP2C-type Ser/Thr phosphatase [Desulfobacteraceae bacterium]
MTEIHLFGQTDPGLVRKNNEDTFFIDKQRGFCLVADGIGGTRGGEIASRLFVEESLTSFAMPDALTESLAADLIRQSFQRANAAILEYATANPGCKGMGCTAELIAFFPDGFVLGHMGDSRSFRLRNNSFKQLTTDHSLVQEQLDQGLISPEEAKAHSYKNVILRAVGIEEHPALDIIKGKVFPGDLFLLCSDGLTDMVSPDLIQSLVSSSGTLEAKTTALVHQAKANGGRDNITVVLAEIL